MMQMKSCNFQPLTASPFAPHGTSVTLAGYDEDMIYDYLTSLVLGMLL